MQLISSTRIASLLISSSMNHPISDVSAQPCIPTSVIHTYKVLNLPTHCASKPLDRIATPTPVHHSIERQKVY